MVLQLLPVTLIQINGLFQDDGEDYDEENDPDFQPGVRIVNV